MPSVNIKKNGQWIGQPVLGFKIGEDNLTDELKDKIDNKSNLEFDDSLTQSGKAADAKAVGDKFENLTASDIGAAPAGYGLGVETPELISDCNNAVNNGWYRVTGAVNLSNGYTDGWVSVSSFNSSYKRQDFYNEYASGVHAVRYMYKNWGEWEWVNPPSGFGTEYRTTERFMGKPVYVKCVNYGYIAAGTTTIAHGISNIDDVVGLDIINRTYGYFSNSADVHGSADRTNVSVTSAWAMGSFVYTIKYTKL